MQYVEQYPAHFPGESVRWKAQRRPWLGNDHERLFLIALTDESNGRTAAHFAHEGSLRENLFAFATYIRCWGRPRQVRTDRSTLFAGSGAGTRAGGHTTQIRRALAELEIRWTPAGSAEDLGGSAAFFREIRKRLPGELASRQRNIRGASQYLNEVFLPEWNARRTASELPDCHRKLLPGHDLNSILGTVHRRTLARDGTLRLDHTIYRLTPFDGEPPVWGQELRVEIHADGRTWARWNGAGIELEEVPEDYQPQQPRPARLRRKARTANRAWMQGFFDRPSSPIWRHLK